MIDIFRLTPAELEQFIHMQRVVERQDAEAQKTRALRDYYDGEHPTLLTARQQEYLGPLVAPDAFPFAYNLMRPVADTLAERLSVTGFVVNGATADDDEGPDADMARLLWAWWKANRLDLIEQRIYAHALVDGKTFTMVDYDATEGRPRIVEHRLDDGERGVRLLRDDADPNRVLFATRYFWDADPLRPTRTFERKTVYLATEIRKYRRSGAGVSVGGWAQMRDEGDPAWPLPWVNAAGQPLGVAVNEFPNPGGSEIEPVIGLQNALNKTWLDLVAAADASGFPIMAVEYQAGLMPPAPAGDDNIEGADELRIGPGRMLELDGATFRRIEAANLTPMLDVIEALTTAIAGVSRTPQYYLRPIGGGDVPSGEALKQLESGLVARARKRQRVFGQAWEDTLRTALRVANAFGPFSLPEDAQIEIVWADAETRNEFTVAQTAEAHKRLNVPDEMIWQMLGYTPDQIAQFRADARADDASRIAAAVAAMRTTQPATPPTTGVAQTGGNTNGRNGDAL